MAQRLLDAEPVSEDPKAIYREILKTAYAYVTQKGESLFITPLRLDSMGDEVLALQAVLVLLDVLEPSSAFVAGTFDKPTLRALATVQVQSNNNELRAELSADGTLGPNTLAFLNDMAQKLVGGAPPAQLRTAEREASTLRRRQEADVQYLKTMCRIGEAALRRSIIFDPKQNRYSIRLPEQKQSGVHFAHIALALLGYLKIEDLAVNLHSISNEGVTMRALAFSPFSKQALLDFQYRYAPEVDTEDFGTEVCDETWTAIAEQLAKKWGLNWELESHQGHQAEPRPAVQSPPTAEFARRWPVTESLSGRLKRGVEEVRLAQADLYRQVSRRVALGTLFGLGLGVAGTVGAGWHFRSALLGALGGDATEEKALDLMELRSTDDLMQRRVDCLDLPDDLTDTEVLLWAAAPVWDGRRGVFYDTMLSRYALSRYLFAEKILLLDKHDSIQYGETSQRAYDFTIPDKFHGETLDYGQGTHGLSNTTLADALNLVTRAPEASDQEVKAFLVWWYKKTFKNNADDPIQLEPDKLTIRRFSDGKIESVLYSGSHQGDSIYVQQKIRRPDVSPTSAQPGFYSHPTLKPLMGSNGRLLIWTGFEQPFRVPASFLAQQGHAKFKFNGWTVPFEWYELAQSVRHYFEIRDQGSRISYIDHRGKRKTVPGWSHFVDYNDPVIQRLVEAVTKGLTGYARLEALRRFGQSVEYQSEAGVEVNRPALATLLQSYQQSGGDCNNRSVALATLFKAAGYRTALVYATNDPAKDKSTEAQAHLLVAVHLDEFRDLPESQRPASYRLGNDRWVVVETGHPDSCTFGNSGCIPGGHVVRQIEEVRQIR